MYIYGREGRVPLDGQKKQRNLNVTVKAVTAFGRENK